MSTSLASLEPDTRSLAEEWLARVREEQIPFRISSTRRSRAEQARLFRRFQRGESRFPVAPPGTSTHESGEALDVVFQTGEDAQSAAAFLPEGLIWPDPIGDSVHFEKEDAAGPEDTSEEGGETPEERVVRGIGGFPADVLSLGAKETRRALCRLGFKSFC